MFQLSRLSTKLQESLIQRAAVKSAEIGAIDLAQGIMETKISDLLKAAVCPAICKDQNQYSDSWGSGNLAKKIAKKSSNLYDMALDTDDNITITCGSTEAMFASLLAVVNPKDEVIVLEPAYESYRNQCLMVQARFIGVPLVGVGFSLDYDRIERAFNNRTAAIIINNPNNPCGKVYSRDELRFIGRLCKRFDAVAISDEVYEHFVYDGKEHICIGSLSEFENRYIVISSLSKSYAISGWRIGYCIASKELSSCIRRCHGYITVAAPTPLQEAAAIAMEYDLGFYEKLLMEFDRKRLSLCQCLKKIGLKCLPPEGGQYVFADCSSMGFINSVVFCDYLLNDIGVGSVPWAFPADLKTSSKVRFSFSRSESTVHEAIEKLLRLQR